MELRTSDSPSVRFSLANAAKPEVEGLEPRLLLATFAVSNALDAGAGSLRQAILDANANPGADVVQFDPALSGSTILLSSGQMAIADDLHVQGPGADLLAIIAGGVSRIFHIDDGTPADILVRLDGLTLAVGAPLSEESQCTSSSSKWAATSLSLTTMA